MSNLKDVPKEYEPLLKEYLNLNRKFDDLNQNYYDCNRQKKIAEALQVEYQNEIETLQSQESTEKRKWETKIAQIEEDFAKTRVYYNERIHNLENELQKKEEDCSELQSNVDLLKNCNTVEINEDTKKLYDEISNLKCENECLVEKADEFQVLLGDSQQKCSVLEENVKWKAVFAKIEKRQLQALWITLYLICSMDQLLATLIDKLKPTKSALKLLDSSQIDSVASCEKNNNLLCSALDVLVLKNYLCKLTSGLEKHKLYKLIMNNSSLLMSSLRAKMGIQKTIFDSNTDNSDMLNNLNFVMPSSDFSDLKSIEDSTVVPDNEFLADAEESFPISGADLANNTSSFEKEFLNDVELMNIGISDEIDSAEKIKEARVQQLHTDLSNKHFKLERRLDFLKRRVNKLQLKHMGVHVSGEVTGVFEYTHQLLKSGKDPSQEDSNDMLYKDQPFLSNNYSIVENEDVKPMTQSSTRNLIRKLQMTSILQANSVSRQRHSTKYFGSSSVEPPVLRPTGTGMTTIPPWNSAAKQELQKVSKMLVSEMSALQREVDSEATDSSSGGESCDEMQTFNNPHQQYLSIQKRALWKYANDRAAIAAKWTWLQAQISDLEYRIRQHTDLHRQIRSEKGPVVLNDPTQSVAKPVNGCQSNEALNLHSDQCSRTRPLVSLKKRKLLQVAGLHAISKKAIRPSTVRCGCVPMTYHCALCTGRTDPTHPRDPPETLSAVERVSLIDPSFHPVFSLREDTSQRIHLEAIMKTPDWQQRSVRMKSLKYYAKAEKVDKGLMEHRSNKYNKLKAIKAKLKNRIRGRKSGRYLHRLNRKRYSAKLAMSQNYNLKDGAADDDMDYGEMMNSHPLPDSLRSSPVLPVQSISNKKNRVSSYDIDNIVIPYSVAALTRVEKLQYKEILTPKWRLADVEGSNKSNDLTEEFQNIEDNEDVSEDAVTARHDRCEFEERKKLLSYLKLPMGYGRRRSHKRTDSHAESSGANTPEVMSPYPMDHVDVTSPIASPPEVPATTTTAEESGTGAPAAASQGLKRTASQTRDSSNDFRTQEVVEPFESRVFPLGDDVYQNMLKSMPEDHQLKTNIRSQDSSLKSQSGPLDYDEKMDSPGTESTESALGDEDPNDPEWNDIVRTRDRYHRR